MADVYLGLGSNLGNRMQRLADARNRIERKAGTITAASSIYDTAPWGPVPQDNFLNQVIRISTALEPRELLAVLHEIERDAGRDRKSEIRFGPRTLDLDILLYGDRVLHEEGLAIPHPRLTERAFVLAPLAEIAPDLQVGGLTVRELLGRIDSKTVARYDPI
jgi:2-amino-4-hydroxy-6-hydroxymethyldihydropteridine diphosphokinase